MTWYRKSKCGNYTAEFKEEAVKLITDQEYKITEAARNIGLHDSLLRRWINGKSSKGNYSSADMVQLRAELKQVKRENERLRMEREI